jgi:copper resistance protein B
MSRALLLASTLLIAAPSIAQDDPHAGHAMPQEQVDPHAGHQMAEPQAEDPHAGHTMPQEQADPHAGHDMSAMPESQADDPHAGHDMGASDIPVAPAPPEATGGPEHAADAVWDPSAMAASRQILAGEHGGASAFRFVADTAEIRWGKGRPGYEVEADFWIGKDIDKLWLKAEVEGEFGRAVEDAEFQALWSHAIGPFWDLQSGLRQDVGHGSDRTHLVLGVQGLAPYWFEIDAAAFLSHKGELTARIEGEYDLRITNRLILQPRLELDFAAENIPERGIGAGLSTASLGARLRYEITPLFAPYIGMEAGRAFARTADYRRREGEDRGELVAVTGIRFGF